MCNSGSAPFPACRSCLSDLLWGECCLCCLCKLGTGVSSGSECWASAATLSGEFPAELFRAVTLWWVSQHLWAQMLVGLCAPRAKHGPGPSLGHWHVVLFGRGFSICFWPWRPNALLRGKFSLWIQAMKALLVFTPPPFNCFPCPLGHNLIPSHLGKYRAVLWKDGASPNRAVLLGSGSGHSTWLTSTGCLFAHLFGLGPEHESQLKPPHYEQQVWKPLGQERPGGEGAEAVIPL